MFNICEMVRLSFNHQSLLNFVNVFVIVFLSTHIHICTTFNLLHATSYRIVKSCDLIRCFSSKIPIPKDKVFSLADFQFVRILGKLDIQVSGNSNSNEVNGVTSVKLYEGKLRNEQRIFIKEFLPIGLPFGKNELIVTRKLVNQWNRVISSENTEDRKKLSVYNDIIPPFPKLLGYMYSNDSIESMEFRQEWRKRFPRSSPPEANNFWLFFEWEANTFRTLRTFPPLPQVIEGFDYFRKDQRIVKRWLFIRKVIRKAIESLEYLHLTGYSHNAMNIQSLWMSTTIQQEIQNVSVQITDLGAANKLSEDPTEYRNEIINDFYRMGFVILELIISSFNEDYTGANKLRMLLGKDL